LAFGLFLVTATLLPLSKIPHGALRGLAFPREQFFGMAVILAVVAPILYPNLIGWSSFAVLVAIASIQLIYVVKFTPIWTKQSVDACADLRANVDRHLSILSANVKKSNRDFDRLIAMIRARWCENAALCGASWTAGHQSITIRSAETAKLP
tara:strand:- start:89 stop:544 length:456 start_codon:yes stop_codon:yes gene_type:complete